MKELAISQVPTNSSYSHIPYGAESVQTKNGSFQVVPRTLAFVVGREFVAPLIQGCVHTFRYLGQRLSTLDKVLSSLFLFPGADALNLPSGEECREEGLVGIVTKGGSHLDTVAVVDREGLLPAERTALIGGAAAVQTKKTKLFLDIQSRIHSYTSLIEILEDFCRSWEKLEKDLSEIDKDLDKGPLSEFYPDSRKVILLTFPSLTDKGEVYDEGSLRVNGDNFPSGHKIDHLGWCNGQAVVEQLLFDEFYELFKTIVGPFSPPPQMSFKFIESHYSPENLQELDKLYKAWQKSANKIDERIRNKAVEAVRKSSKAKEDSILVLIHKIRTKQTPYLNTITTPNSGLYVSPDGLTWGIQTKRSRYDIPGHLEDYIDGGSTLFSFTTKR